VFKSCVQQFYQDYGAIGDGVHDDAAAIVAYQVILPLYTRCHMTCSLAISDQDSCGGGNCSSSTYVPLRK
jgi:hypothetical protein